METKAAKTIGKLYIFFGTFSGTVLQYCRGRIPPGHYLIERNYFYFLMKRYEMIVHNDFDIKVYRTT